MTWNFSNIAAYTFIGILLIAFLLLAYKDLGLLFRSPGKNMGTGLARIWAVARITILEARAARVWLLPLIWLIISLILLNVVRPFDASERIPLYIKVLLLGQEVLLLVMLGIMACLSFPRDRERKIVISTASKPISRLEMFLGKIVGFSTVAFFLLVIMGLLTWSVLLLADRKLRDDARAQYLLSDSDYKRSVERREQAVVQGESPQAVQDIVLSPPSEGLKRLAAEGSLYAYNYITVPRRTGFSVAGFIDFQKDPPARYIKGGSSQKIIYRFPGGVLAPSAFFTAPVGQRPFFFFNFGILGQPQQQPQITVIAKLLHLPQREQSITLNLDNRGIAQWEPERPEELFGSEKGDLGPLEIAVLCPTPGVYLHVMESIDPLNEPSNIIAVGLPPDRSQYVYAPEKFPRVLGFERRDKQQINGPQANGGAPEMAIYRFTADSLKGISLNSKNQFALAMSLDVDKAGNNERDTIARVTAYNQAAPDAPSHTVIDNIRVIEKRVTDVLLPGSLLPDPAKLAGSDLIIMIQCATPKHWIALDTNSVRIELPPSPFFVNLFKSELILLCEAILLIIICVTTSLRLGWPVAVLTSSVCVILGNCAEFIKDLQGAGGLGSLGFTPSADSGSGFHLIDSTLKFFYALLEVLVWIMPNFTRFDSMAYIVELRNTPWTTVGLNFALVILFALPFIAAGYLSIRKQELG